MQIEKLEISRCLLPELSNKIRRKHYDGYNKKPPLQLNEEGLVPKTDLFKVLNRCQKLVFSPVTDNRAGKYNSLQA